MRYLKHAMALSLASALAACGGGGDENETVAATFQTNVVNVSSQTVKAGNIINGVAEFKTFGPTIESVVWSVMATTDSVGSLAFSDAECESPEINNRDVSADKKSSLWRCQTEISAPKGSKGNFRVFATATDSNGNTAKDEILVTVTP
ncbi:hypothetical protein ACFQNJ_16470 [Hydrogenophaga bisanensis]|jgi:hypothetical protein|uniref:Uncharacterized protein n=1 Tax=Hydrogenophaga bisanensis TaxID=439611 RepID=A0ABW2RDE4_9BURK